MYYVEDINKRQRPGDLSYEGDPGLSSNFNSDFDLQTSGLHIKIFIIACTF